MNNRIVAFAFIFQSNICELDTAREVASVLYAEGNSINSG